VELIFRFNKSAVVQRSPGIIVFFNIFSQYAYWMTSFLELQQD